MASNILTEKQKHLRILAVARRIPEGKIASYSMLAALAGLPGRARMAGKALGASLASQDVPWHRVIRADGKIAFPLESLNAKTQIAKLRAEGVEVNKGRISVKQYLWNPDLFSS